MTFDLFFYEQVGVDRYHLRITPFAIVLILIVMAFGYTILWLDGRQQTVPKKVSVPSPTPYSPSYPIIKQVPPPPKPKAVRQPKANASMPSPPTLTRNTNEQ